MSNFQFLVVLLFISLATNQSIAQKNTLTKNEITQLAHSANANMKAGNFEKSLLESRLALKYAIATKDNNGIASCYNTIAANFDELAEFDKAFYFYKKGLLYANKTNNTVLKNWINNNLGNIYCFDKKQYEKGIYYYKKSLGYSREMKDSSQMVFTKLNITWAYFDIGEFQNGLPYLNFINKHHQNYGGESTIVALNMLNGMYYSYKNETKKAVFYFEKAIELGNKGNEKSDLSYTYQEYSKLLFKTGNFKYAYTCLNAYNTITDALNTEEKLKKTNVAGINLQIDEYKRDIDKIATDYKTKQHVLLEEQSRNKKIVIVVISLLLTLFVLFYFFTQNKQLKQKNKIKDIQSKIQQNIINASIDGQELERKKIAAFLHDNISALLSSAGLHLNVFTSSSHTPSEEILKTKYILSEAHLKIRDLSHELMPALLVRFGLLFALDDLCEKNSNSRITFEFDNSIPIKKRYPEKLEMKVYFIISELLNNIIKHSKASKAICRIDEKGAKLHIIITDNGKGFDTKKFHVVEGFGLNQVRARIKNMEGEFSVISKINYGTTVELLIPINDI